MTEDRFTTLVSERMDKTRATLMAKAKEYARGDRLSNFKKAAAALNCSPERACVGMWMKHVISINDFVNDLEQGQQVSAELWNEKIGDAMAYLYLLEGLLQDRGY